MFQAADFRVVQAHAVVFTPGLQFRSARLLPHLLTSHADLFDGEPRTLDVSTLPLADVVGIPRIILKSSDGLWTLQAGPARLDVFRRTAGPEPVPLEEFLDKALRIFNLYEEAAEATVGRLACVVHRQALHPDAAREVARHFCRDEWLAAPLNRPSDFELHAAKQFNLLPDLPINSWFRCRAGLVALTDPQGQPVTPAQPGMVDPIV